MTYPLWQWASFFILIFILLILDLGVFNRGKKNQPVTAKSALIKSIFFISSALLFNAFIYFWLGQKQALEFLTGYLIEEALSVDNLFVFIMIFAYFGIQPKFQNRILFWGILGALIMRGLFIGVGSLLIERFHWIMYVFGALLIYSAVKMFRQKDDEEFDPKKNFILNLTKRFLPIKEDHSGESFFTRVNGKLFVTPFFIVLLVVETSDLMFAVDSIPAIFAITKDPFIIFTSNIFAILGLRSLYFLLASVMGSFYYLKHGVALILGFVGVKMLVEGFVPISIGISLAVIFATLAVSILASVFKKPKH